MASARLYNWIFLFSKVCFRIAHRTNLRFFYWFPNHLLFYLTYRRLPDRQRLNVKPIFDSSGYSRRREALCHNDSCFGVVDV